MANAAEQLPTTPELTSEAWEAKRDVLINKIKQEVAAGKLGEMEVAELSYAMAQYSLKDALLLAKHIPTSPEARGVWIASLIGTFDRSKGSHDPNTSLRTRILRGLELSQDPQRVVETWRNIDQTRALDVVNIKTDIEDLIKRTLQDESQGHRKAPTLAQEPLLQEALNALAIPDDAPDARLDDTTQPISQQIDALYAPFFARELDRGSHDVRNTHDYPSAITAIDFLDRCQHLEEKRPFYLHSLRDLIFRKRFGIPVPAGDLTSDTRTVFDHATQEHLPLNEALRRIRREGTKVSIDSAFAVEMIAGDPKQDASNKAIEIEQDYALEALKVFGIDKDALDTRVKLQQAQIKRLDLVLRIQAKLLREKVQAELQGARAKLAREQRLNRTVLFFLKKQAQAVQDLEAIANSLLEVEKYASTASWNYRAIPAHDHGVRTDSPLKRLGQAANGLIQHVLQRGSQNPKESAIFAPAKVDDFSNAEVAEVIKSLFPVNGDALAQHAKTVLDHEQYMSTPNWKLRSFDSPSPSDFFHPAKGERSLDGDPRDPHPVRLAEFSEPIDAILVTGVFQKRSDNRGKWEQGGARLAAEKEPSLLQKTVMTKIPASLGMTLPVPLFGTIHEPIIAIRANQSQAPAFVERDEMGRFIVKSFPPDTTHISFGMDVPTRVLSVHDIARDTYTKWYQARLKEIGEPNRQEEARKSLPADCLPFLDSIRQFPPAEQVQAIESYARSIGYYDFANGETRGNRIDVDLKTRWKRMRERMKELQARSSDNTELQKRKVAGVCIDYHEIVSTLLNAAGFVSGKISCLRVQGEATATNKDSHALSYVEWPNERGDFDLIPVDGTPSGTDAEENKDLAKIQEPSLLKRRQLEATDLFEREMDIQGELHEAQQKSSNALQALQETYFLQTKPAPEQRLSLAASAAWRERLTNYINESLAPAEQRAFQACVAWLAYSGVLRSSTEEHASTNLQTELQTIYNSEIAHDTRLKADAISIVRDWSRLADICNKQHIPLKAIGQAIEQAVPTSPTTKQKRVLTYLVKGFQH